MNDNTINTDQQNTNNDAAAAAAAVVTSDSTRNVASSKLDPKVWGPHVWGTMDAFVAGYGEHPDASLKKAAIDFFYSLQHLLPCPHCREHYKVMMRQNPPVERHVASSSSLRSYVAWIKNEVAKNVRQQQQQQQKISSSASSSSFALKRNAPAATAANHKNNNSSIARNTPAKKPAALIVRKNRNSKLKYMSTEERLRISLENYVRPCAC